VHVGGAAYLDKYEAQNPDRTIRVHAGDMVGASPLISSYFHEEPTIYAANNMEFDVGQRRTSRATPRLPARAQWGI
jgi:2',3'-cyclic-nucleotide 2'-phosphodiesterase (5'-nucleotidase family)